MFDSLIDTAHQLILMSVSQLDDLFPQPPHLDWLPGETLFSLVSRHHCLHGHAVASQTCKYFFGHARAGSQHDLPCRLSNFEALTDGCFGSANEIARARTLIAYYQAFLKPDETQDAIASMAGPTVAHLKLKLGILTSRFRANHPLKACTTCMHEDQDAHGWPYWHVQHQFPGVWVCPTHGLLLRESMLKSSGVERFLWHLPSMDALRPPGLDGCVPSAKDVSCINDFSHMVLETVGKASSCPIDVSKLHLVYSAELERTRGLSTFGQSKISDLAADYLQRVQSLRQVAELAGLPATQRESELHLYRFLRSARSGTHPIRHLALIYWLFGNSESFWRAYTSQSVVSDPLEKRIPRASKLKPDKPIDPKKTHLIELIKTERHSFRRAASAVGVDVSTAMAWAAAAGLAPSRRPKKLSGKVRESALRALRRGRDKAHVAQQAGISIGTVTRLLLTEPGLHDEWRLAREQQTQTRARATWLGLLQSHAQLGIKLMREMEPATFVWLYRHDHAWLKLNSPPRRTLDDQSASNRVA
jgi:hypothetical protein